MHKREIWLLVIACLTSTLFILAVGSDERPLPKINGVSFVAPRKPITINEMHTITQINANWVAIIPYAFSRAETPEILFNHERQWWGERSEGVIETIKMARTLDNKVMLKPHVWVRGQGWAGDFELTSEADWKTWENNYQSYILTYAKIADSLNVELLCIGTEYRKATVLRPQFWTSLIKEIRKIYSGKLTYAANWDNYQNITFWPALDYIGIDVYFPLSETRTPQVDELTQSWETIASEIGKTSHMYKKQVLFTEFGYQSIDYTAAGHWNYHQDTLQVNQQAQLNAFDAIFSTFWDKPWFAGGFVWKWHAWHDQYGGPLCKRFTPQNKPAQQVIGNWYKQTGPATYRSRTEE